jgi:hypothetical protein
VIYYGILLFIAGILVGGYCGWVIAEKFVSPFLIAEGIISLGSPLEKTCRGERDGPARVRAREKTLPRVDPLLSRVVPRDKEVKVVRRSRVAWSNGC